MSNIGVIIEERAANVGNFMVGRLLPFRQKRMVGPFVFIDHMGPAVYSDYETIDVGPHPHIGLSTLTYLFEGATMHRDSLGTEMEIKPGAVNFMTAGKGVTHSERTPEYLKHTDKLFHGLQIWVALPKELEECEPSFEHTNAEDLPAWQDDQGIHYKLIAGEAFNKKSPVSVFSKLYFIEIKATKAGKINIGKDLYGESALYILEGSIKDGEDSFTAKQLLVAKNATLCEFEIAADTTIYIFGGEPFPEERYILWNFVSSSKERLEQAKQDWNNKKFPSVPNETSYIPLPEYFQNK